MNTSSRIQLPSSNDAHVYDGRSNEPKASKRSYVNLTRQMRPKDALKMNISSPNLKDLSKFADPDAQQWLEGYLAGKLEDNSKTPRSNFVDPLYEELNARRKPNKPVWSLSGPLPHVLGNSVVEKLEARSRASSVSNSRLNSRTNSSVSLKGMDGSSSWKNKIKNAVSNVTDQSKR
ncbi:hypothetical protein POMI540_2024 [Schizosaccharomyces pombe]|uniref:Uncharacterized protein C186.04c n=1 Tax=Schizosaccharomyces pombe (strain 972 / ATCC 24843) TaxID=284812 RepID=YLY4_SCHPO|nr:uncharacterized protein SPAC186.04c [Schizosaccharomyces pombe]G2TRL1.1 RecName: Full=Uncharacterized protein C186.04c [Schizosaccharomyces pombe 972h-]pir/T50131/ probable pseudogene, homologous to N terminal of transmembrane channel [imported] - fission yeast (Schizosaccharomyces pombe) [Schizosaccharomyces pombe]CCD31348.1 N-terminal of transmembrane channel, trunucated [Schizosaccharomyces pombe]|eukprot:NP_001343138.1 uncharacterized protein SPAC186.04c [Schizosaccharomyces pombe]